MAIIINPELIFVPVDAKDAHHGLLRDELKQAVGAHVKGVAAMEHGNTYAHVQTVVSDVDTMLISNLMRGYEGKQYPEGTDVRLAILADLQAAFPQVTDLAFMNDPRTGQQNAYITVRGDVPDGTNEKIGAVVAQHDPSKAPPPEPTDKERIARLEAMVLKLSKGKE